MHTFTVRIDEDVYEQLRQRAFDHRCSQQSVVVGAIRHFLLDHPIDEQPVPKIDTLSIENGVKMAVLDYLRETGFDPDDSAERAALAYLREGGSAA